MGSYFDCLPIPECMVDCRWAHEQSVRFRATEPFFRQVIVSLVGHIQPIRLPLLLAERTLLLAVRSIHPFQHLKYRLTRFSDVPFHFPQCYRVVTFESLRLSRICGVRVVRSMADEWTMSYNSQGTSFLHRFVWLCPEFDAQSGCQLVF